MPSRRSRPSTAWSSAGRRLRGTRRVMAMRPWPALALAIVVLGACTAPAATPGDAVSPTLTVAPSSSPSPSAAPTVEPTATTLVRTPEPIPTGSPQAAPPAIQVVSGVFAVATATPLIEVVGPYRTTTEADLRRWVPMLLEGLDKIRVDPYASSSRALLDILYAPGPYAELIRQSLAPLRATRQGEQRKFELAQLAIQ